MNGITRLGDQRGIYMMGGTGGLGGIGGVSPPGGAGYDIPQNGLLAWLQADDITGLNDGDDIVTWPNTGSEGDASPGGSAPTYETSEQNSLPGVDFVGANGDELDISFTTQLNNFSCFAVVNVDDFAGFYGVICKSLDSSDRNMYFITRQTAGTVTIGFTSAAATYEELSTSGALTAGTTAVIEGKFDNAGDEFTVGINGTLVTGTETAVPEDTSNGNNIQIGHDFGSENMNGFIFEAICYSRAVSTAESTTIRDYLNGKWVVY